MSWHVRAIDEDQFGEDGMHQPEGTVMSRSQSPVRAQPSLVRDDRLSGERSLHCRCCLLCVSFDWRRRTPASRGGRGVTLR